MNSEFIKWIPNSLIRELGGVFYSGKDAFSGKKDLYILGLNPGGVPDVNAGQTLEENIEYILKKGCNWSEYRDESWEGAEPGTWRMQPRVLHLLSQLELDPGQVPSSNLIFIQSPREKDISKIKYELAEECWPFHMRVIEGLEIKVVLCFGKMVGNFVRNKLSAVEYIDEFIENNKRKWRSQVYRSPKGIYVVIATHPSVVDWLNINTDPTPMIKKIMPNNGN